MNSKQNGILPHKHVKISLYWCLRVHDAWISTIQNTEYTMHNNTKNTVLFDVLLICGNVEMEH